jgi:hypothetical protein
VNRSRPKLRAATLAFIAFSGLTCSLQDDATGPGSPSVAGFQIAPVVPPEFSRFAVGLGIEQIHLVVQRLRAEVLRDTVIPFAPTATSLTIRLPVLLSARAESLQVQLSYETITGTVLFTGQRTILVNAGLSTTTPQVPLSYVGPGANVSYLYVTPSDSVFSFGGTAVLDVQAYDTVGAQVPNVYVNWQTDDPSIAIDAQGRLRVPNSSGMAVIYAQTPNGSFGGTRVYFAPGQTALTPDSVEVMPGQTLYFSTYGPGLFGSYSWTVNGIPGGDSTVGTIDQFYGIYAPPAVPPIPARVNICASQAADTVCAQVTVASPPSPAGDLVVLGDTYLLTDGALTSQAGNRTLASQLATYSGAGSRVAGRTIIFDRGRNAPCLASGVCADSALNSLTNQLVNTGYQIRKVDTAAVYKNIGPAVKVIVMWNPQVYLDDRETNELKRFARQGGRIVLVADDTTSLGGSSSNVLNVVGDMIYRLSYGGAYPSYTDAACGIPSDVTGTGIHTHQTTSGVTTIRMSCATELGISSGGYPLLTINQQVVAAAVKVNPTPDINSGD